jgi:hypothetical protein
VFAEIRADAIIVTVEHQTSQAELDTIVKQLAQEMLEYCGPILIVPGINSWPDQMIANATYSLIDTGQKRLLITCHHVWQGYLDRRAQDPRCVLALNLGDGEANIAFSHPESCVIDSDPDLDLAVFDFEPDHIKLGQTPLSHQKKWFPVPQWPMKKASEGDTIVLMGFPGSLIRKAGRLCTFTAQHVPMTVSGVGHKTIMVFNHAENRESLAWINKGPGGLSGSPAYTRDENGEFRIVGFVRAGCKKLDAGESTGNETSLFAGSLVLTHSCFLQPDRKLIRPA